ncbi:hypothetical protein [Magnetospirillum sp. UT-4]|uniref:hypothetical protein n=1 Tax=Magnetospirillum sp. UT-4 TaxID=2681467 RepID=UPI00137F3C1D|nr:hypothetical protein [Magnetospirillum sp. UT-4]CAA7611528.1 conserved membrane hypothetical protein [Magnetospirillum sp. UT-4]
MIRWNVVAAGVSGAWELARRRPQGLQRIDGSPAGYWHSFWAAVLVAPAFVALQLLGGGFGEDFTFRIGLAHAIAYVIDWTAFPLVMIVVADSLDRWPAYMRYIAAYNWSAVVQIAVLLPAAAAVTLMPHPVLLMLVQGITVILLVYRAYIAHVALDVGLPTAAGIVLLDVLLSGLTNAVTDRVAGG